MTPSHAAQEKLTSPRTEAGRDLLARCESGWKTWMDEPIRVNGMRRMILAIEREAAAAALARLDEGSATPMEADDDRI